MRSWKFLRAKDGTVAIEFAFIAPVLILLLLGSVELCYALICREKVSTVAASASDLVAQDDTITGTQMNDVFSALGAILYPYPSSGSSVIITSIKQDPNHVGQYIVDWSTSTPNVTAHSKGASITVPTGLVTSGGSVILAEVSYSYVPPFTQGITSGFTMTDTFYSRPRKSTFVVYNP
jgi:Flp pilus assembly protein TadG